MQCHKGANWKVHWSRCHQCNYTRLKLSRYSNWLKMVTGLAAANHHNALFVHTLKIVNDISPRSIIWRVQFIDFCLIWKKYCGQIIVQFLRLVSLIFDQSAFLAVIVSITFLCRRINVSLPVWKFSTDQFSIELWNSCSLWLKSEV